MEKAILARRATETSGMAENNPDDSARQSQVQRVVVRVEYDPTLAVYNRMDDVAILLEQHFPLWERGPLGVEIRNPKHCRRFAMAHNLCVFEALFPENASDELSVAVKSMNAALSKFGVKKATRAVVSVVTAAPDERTIPDLVEHLEKRFQVPIKEIPAFQNHRLTDTAFIVVVADEAHPQWKMNVMVGPMTQREWQVKNPLDNRVLDIAVRPLAYYWALTPERFIHIGIDSSCVNIDAMQATKGMVDAGVRAVRLAAQIQEYIGV